MSELFEYTHDKWQWIYDDIPGDTVFDDDMNPIAIVCPYDERNKIGRLIAAAPEMYEMLKVLLQKIGKNFAVIDFGSPLVPTSKELHSDMKVWEAKSFFDFREIKELLARIDGGEHEELHEVEANHD